MRSALTYASLIIVIMVLGACAGQSGANPPSSTAIAAAAPFVDTAAPAAREVSGSTEAAPAATDTAPTAALAEQATAVPTAAAVGEPSVTASTNSAPVPTSVPEPTTPPAPTEPMPTEVVPLACTPGEVTPAQTEGPYYSANPPETSSLVQPGMTGTKVTITGYVLDAQCQPIPGARVDFWQADAEGQYDNQGYTLRGYQVTDPEGRYRLETVIPGLYPGRTRHIHVKVTPPSGPTLTTQLYFPEEAANTGDRIFSPELVVNLEQATDGAKGTFNFVVPAQ